MSFHTNRSRRDLLRGNWRRLFGRSRRSDVNANSDFTLTEVQQTGADGARSVKGISITPVRTQRTQIVDAAERRRKKQQLGKHEQ